MTQVPSLFHLALGELARNRIRVLQGRIPLVTSCKCTQNSQSNEKQSVYSKFVESYQRAAQELRDHKSTLRKASLGALSMPNLLASPAIEEVVDAQQAVQSGFRARILDAHDRDTKNAECPSLSKVNGVPEDTSVLPMIRKDVYYLGTLSHRSAYPLEEAARSWLSPSYQDFADETGECSNSKIVSAQRNNYSANIDDSFISVGRWVSISPLNNRQRIVPSSEFEGVLKRLRIDGSLLPPSSRKLNVSKQMSESYAMEEYHDDEKEVDLAWDRYRKWCVSIGGVDTNKFLETQTEFILSSAVWSFLQVLRMGGYTEVTSVETAPPRPNTEYIRHYLSGVKKIGSTATKSASDVSTLRALHEYEKKRQEEKRSRWCPESDTDFTYLLSAMEASIHATHIAPPQALAVIADLFDETQFDAFCEMYPGVLTQPSFQERLLRAAQAKYPLIAKDILNLAHSDYHTKDSKSEITDKTLDSIVSSVDVSNGKTYSENSKSQKVFDAKVYNEDNAFSMFSDIGHLDPEAKSQVPSSDEIESMEAAKRHWTRERLALFFETPLSMHLLAPTPISVDNMGPYVSLPTEYVPKNSMEVKKLPYQFISKNDLKAFEEKTRLIIQHCSAKPVSTELEYAQKFISRPSIGEKLIMQKPHLSDPTNIAAKVTAVNLELQSQTLIPISKAVKIGLPPFSYLLEKLPPSILYWVIREYVTFRVIAMEKLHQHFRQTLVSLENELKAEAAAAQAKKEEAKEMLKAKEEMLKSNKLLGTAMKKAQSAQYEASVNSKYPQRTSILTSRANRTTTTVPSTEFKTSSNPTQAQNSRPSVDRTTARPSVSSQPQRTASGRIAPFHRIAIAVASTTTSRATSARSIAVSENSEANRPRRVNLDTHSSSSTRANVTRPTPPIQSQTRNGEVSRAPRVGYIPPPPGLANNRQDLPRTSNQGTTNSMSITNSRRADLAPRQTISRPVPSNSTQSSSVNTTRPRTTIHPASLRPRSTHDNNQSQL